MIYFNCDYMEGAHPNILKRLQETNMDKTVGYGDDPYTESAKARIREACDAPDSEVMLLVGGTQTNDVVIASFLQPYQGVIAPTNGHIARHEAGAIEHSGHKVLALPGENYKLSAEQIREYCWLYYKDASKDHMVMPGMVYISQPTEYGTLYSLEELTAIRKVCDEYNMALYVDGARLAYALGSPENDVTLKDLARLTDVFYIGGTKCGALFGEAVVVRDPKRVPHMFMIAKQHGAVLAKGRLLGIQYDELFKDDLYLKIGQHAINMAMKIKNACKEKGYVFYNDSPTNQQFVIISNEKEKEMSEWLEIEMDDTYDEDHIVMRLCTSWATKEEDVDALIERL
ncbi:MAG: low specificity L-threonine aldolase [Firmicutes bacterium]|nr:low specificity L-threonine aldolase [Bacillota bacterium]MBQ1715984.1 low specificity L-threonine aldolase [Bacillota bacterium]MBQ2305579.1 low specificity L-threonine aldolase [Bacillota bacterium]MEE3382878.1 aminotransferase class I/II-fold pyridoxal phosphate-dependent enzyme [Anaerovoracaceae bacterium]